MTTASTKSELRLNQAVDALDATIVSFTNNIGNVYLNDKIVGEKNVARLLLKLPSLETDNNKIVFKLSFNNKTVEYIGMEMYLFSVTDDLPKANTSVAKWILGVNLDVNSKPTASPVHDDEGQPLYKSLQEFSTFKLGKSTSRLYSILRENKTQYDQSDLASSLAGKTIIIKSFYNDKIKDYSICTTDYNPPTGNSREDDKPAVKQMTTARSRAGAGTAW